MTNNITKVHKNVSNTQNIHLDSKDADYQKTEAIVFRVPEETSEADDLKKKLTMKETFNSSMPLNSRLGLTQN